MEWIHKRETNPSLSAPLFPGVELSGLNAKVKDLALLNVTSRLDLSAESALSSGEVLHRVMSEGKEIGTVKDVFTAEEWVREFSLSLPLSFYVTNLKNHPLDHITPNRLYQENGELVIREKADETAGLYFRGENAILHTEGNQLLLTAKAGASRFTFRYVK